MSCKGTCIRYKAKKPVGTGRYASGQRRCQICEIFIKHEGLWCPCCGYRLRTKPRNLKYKAKLNSIEVKAGATMPVYKLIDGIFILSREGKAELIRLLDDCVEEGRAQLWATRSLERKEEDPSCLTYPRYVIVS